MWLADSVWSGGDKVWSFAYSVGSAESMWSVDSVWSGGDSMLTVDSIWSFAYSVWSA